MKSNVPYHLTRELMNLSNRTWLRSNRYGLWYVLKLVSSQHVSLLSSYAKMSDIPLLPISPKFEIHGVIRFLCANWVPPIEIHRKIKEMYGESTMTIQQVRRWCVEFKKDCTDLDAEPHSGRPTVQTDDAVKRVDDFLRTNWRHTIFELCDEFPTISRHTMHSNITEKLHSWKLCARWVPKMFTENHKVNQMMTSHVFQKFHERGNNFLSCLVTGDEIWIYQDTPDNKRQSMQWKHPDSPCAVKFKQILTKKKIMASMFWDCREIILVEFMKPGTTINGAAYHNILNNRKVIKQKKA